MIERSNNPARRTNLARIVLLVLTLVCAGRVHADGVTTCAKATAVGQDVRQCLDALVYMPLPIPSSTLVLTCPTGVAGFQDQSLCPGNVWKLRSAIALSELIGYCAQAQMTPYAVCDYPTGKEGYLLASTIFGAAPLPPLPPTAAQPATILWDAPTQNTDGSPATITSYRIDYGQGNFANAVTTTATTYTFASLAVGTWQFRVVAFSGTVQSVPSSVVSLTITASCPPLPAIATRTPACPAGTTGTWTQTHDWTPAAYPTCWVATPWLPTSPPAGSCPVASWVVAPSGPRAVYEVVLPLSGGGLVLGNQDGTIASGRACGAEIVKLGTTSYRTISNTDASLASPTYAPRAHVAVCILQ